MAIQNIPRMLIHLFLAALALIALGGCTTATTVVWETAKKLHEKRATEAQFTDTRIGASLMSSLAKKDVGLFMDVNADVWDARVLLTGTVTDQTIRLDVLRQVRNDKRIQKIYNEIQIVSKAEQERHRQQAQRATSAQTDHSAGDFWIETKIAANLVAAKDVTSVNYRWRAVRKTLYVIGSAQSKQELAQVLMLIRTTDGVARVKSFVEIKPVTVT